MEIISVYVNDTDDQNISIQLDDNTTAQEVLRQIAGKDRIIKESELHEYALFAKLDGVEGVTLRERMLSSHECPLKIKKRVQLETKFKFVAKKCLSMPTPMEDNVVSDRNLSEEMIREGVLKRYSKEKWSDRYYILDAKCIYYGKDKKTIAKAFTRIDLETVSVQEASEYGKYCFQLTIAQHNKYILKGNNTQNKEKWMQSISNQCSIVRENREFEAINQNIRKEEKKRSTSDEKLVTDCHDFERLIQIEEGIRLLISLEPKDDIQKCLTSIIDYKNFRIKASQALIRAESNIYSGILNSIEEIKYDPMIAKVFDQQLLDAKQKRLSDIKKLKFTMGTSELEVDLYKELFDDFILRFIECKREFRATYPEFQECILEKLCELPLNRWKSTLKPMPEPMLTPK